MRFSNLLFLFLLTTTGMFAEQKVVLISGATSGIGLATAKAFQKKGLEKKARKNEEKVSLLFVF